MCERVEVSRVRGVQKLSYAEAVKKVGEVGSRNPKSSGVSSRSVLVKRDKPTSDISFSKIGFKKCYSNGYQLYCRDGT